MSLLERALKRVDENFGAQVDCLRRLVALPSVRGGEAPVQRELALELGAAGLASETYEVTLDSLADLPGFSTPEWDYSGRPNLAADWLGTGGGRSLILQGHVDVVPATPLEHWTRDPWGGEVEAGRLYGRGAADMKAGVSAIVYAVRALKEAGARLAGDVLLDFVIEEECTGNGALASLQRRAGRAKADAAIIPEPFGPTQLIAQVGVLWARIEVKGAAAHVLGASGPQAVNAVQKARIVIDAINELERSANSWPRPPLWREVEHPLNYNVGTIVAGDWPSTVPAQCTLEVRLSMFPGESSREARESFATGIRRACAQDAWLREHPPEVTFFAFDAEGFELGGDEEILTTLGHAHASLVGRPLQPYVSTATTDARFYNLYHGIPATCYGPVGENLHAPDEWVDLESVREVTRVLSATILDWCGSEGAGAR